MNREEVYTEAYRDYYPRVKGHLYNSIVNRDEADDICQEIFVDFWEALERFRYEARPGTLLYRIMKRRIADYLRKQYRRAAYVIPLNPECEFIDLPDKIDPLMILLALTEGETKELLLAIKKTKERECIS
jgi:RNA polymerase sigma-70 factor (ECF subfamily)